MMHILHYHYHHHHRVYLVETMGTIIYKSDTLV
jgi:hypothetical protein